MRSFRVAVPDQQLVDLRERLARTRWPERLPAEENWALGAPLDELRSLVDYWRTTFDWRGAEAEINTHPQLVTTIDGTPVHALHVRSPEPQRMADAIAAHGAVGL